MTTILLVDDSKISCKRAKEMLLSIDPSLNILVAFLPSQALEIVDQGGQPIDLAILDYNMPEMDGLELAEKLQSQIPYENIVMLTASSAFITHAQAIPDRMHLIQKPINEDKLSEALLYKRETAA